VDGGDLKVFEAVARLGGMSRAAEEFASGAIQRHRAHQAARKRTGEMLFQHNGRGSLLTPAGRGGSCREPLLEQRRMAVRDLAPAEAWVDAVFIRAAMPMCRAR
jgi:hypothetical protein